MNFRSFRPVPPPAQNRVDLPKFTKIFRNPTYKTDWNFTEILQNLP